MISTERHDASAPQPSPLEAWMLATRPKTLLTGVAPVAAGTAVAFAAGQFHLLAALAALLGAMLIQIGTNLANDYFDFVKGADTDERLGPQRAAQQGWISPEVLRNAMIAVFAAAFMSGLYLVLRAGWPLLIVGLASIAAGILYTGGPKPLGYIGLGDIFVFIFFGPVAVVGTYYVQALEWSPQALLASVPVGLLATAVLVVNNLRDRTTDAKVGKRTLAVRFGPEFARLEYVACILLSYVSVAIGYFVLDFPLLTFLVLASTPLAGNEIKSIATKDGRALNPHLGGTARLCVVFSFLLAAGFVFG
jgi:1,4-dihydroxy-2-naphthoate octaprenyltransferase